MKDPKDVEEFIDAIRNHQKAILAETKKMFILALIYGAVFTIIWTVIGALIPSGNWSIAYNIIMLLISIWIMCAMFYNFFRARMAWGLLAAGLTGVTWVILVVTVKTVIIWLFY